MKLIVYFSLLVLIIFNLILSYNLYNVSKEKSYLSELLSHNQAYNESLLDRYLYSSSLNNQKFVAQCINDSSWIEFQDNELISKKLFLLFSKIECDVCIDREVEILKKYSDSFGEKNIVLLTDSSEKNIRLFSRLYQIEFRLFKINSKHENFLFNNANSPVYFVMDNDMIIKNVFVSDKNFPQQTEQYINSMIQYF